MFSTLDCDKIKDIEVHASLVLWCIRVNATGPCHATAPRRAQATHSRPSVNGLLSSLCVSQYLKTVPSEMVRWSVLLPRAAIPESQSDAGNRPPANRLVAVSERLFTPDSHYEGIWCQLSLLLGEQRSVQAVP